MGPARIALAIVFLLGLCFAAVAQQNDADAQARRLGVEAAQAARADPANSEAIVAARYREALTLATDEASRTRIRSAFQRGYQEALATQAPAPPPRTPAASTLPATAPPAAAQGPRIFDITTARSVAWGQPVGASTVFAPNINPIYVWFRHQGIDAGATLTAVWYFLGTATPLRIGEGSVTVTPHTDWAQFSFTLAADKEWPAGEYRVEVLVGAQSVAETRFQVTAAGTVPPAASAPPAPAGTGQGYVDPVLGYSLMLPPGWVIDTAETGEGKAFKPAQSGGKCSIVGRPAQPDGDVARAAANWEAKFLLPGSGSGLHTKVSGRDIVVGGNRAYEGNYRGDDITGRAVYVAAPARTLVIICMFLSPEFTQRANEIDQFIGAFVPGAQTAVPAPQPAPAPPAAAPTLPKPVKDVLEGLGRILRGR